MLYRGFFCDEVTEHIFPYSTIIPSPLEGTPAVCDGDRLVEQRSGAAQELWVPCWVLGPAPSHPGTGQSWDHAGTAGEPGPLALPLKHFLFTNDLTATSLPLNPAKSPNSPWKLMPSP